MKLVFAEKPSQAHAYAEYLGCSEKKEGYFEGNNYRVTWAVGHLVKLTNLDDYPGFEGKWQDTANKLPYVPQPFKLTIASDNIKKQYFIVKRLFDEASEIIVGTDSGQEGELIFRYIYTLTGCKRPFSRLWLSSLTNDALKKGFENLKPGRDYDNLYYAGRARSESDWILGINLTRLYTLKYANPSIKMVSIGRVQTPTLNLVVKRYIDHTTFVKKPFFTPIIFIAHNGLIFPAKYEESFADKAGSDTILSVVKSTIICSEVVESVIKTSQPKLFNLSHLQQLCNNSFGMTAHKTLEIVQELYESKFVTYPRTDSNYLSNDMIDAANAAYNNIINFAPQITKDVTFDISSKSKNFNNDKVSDHHAIIPTEVSPDLLKLSNDQKLVYLTICERFLQAFAPTCEENRIQLSFKEGSLPKVFKVAGKTPLNLGWKLVDLLGSYKPKDKKDDNKEDDEDGDLSLPRLEKGLDYSVSKKETKQGVTKPLPLHTEASLLKVMENASDTLDDNESDVKFGIGTPATRANIIETILQRLYIKRDGKKLIPTQAGEAIYRLTKDELVGRVLLTAEFEQKLILMAKGEYQYSSFISEITQLAATSSLSLATNGIESEDLNLTSQTQGETIACSKCNKGIMVEREKFFGCSMWKEGCDNKIWKGLLNRTISLSNYRQILSKGKTGKLKFISPKTNNEFEAYVVIKDGRFSLEFPSKK